MEENKLNFDLQLFAEGDAPAEPAADNTVGVEQLLEDSTEADTTPEQTNDNYDWKIDENGNVTFSDNMFADQNMYSPDGEQTEKVEGQEETKDEPQEPNPDLPPKPEFYDVVINGEPQKVTLEQLRQGYMLQSDYTRKTQQLAEERRAFEAAKGQFAQQNPQMQQQQQPVQETKPNPKEYYEQLSNYAIGRVKQNLGEDFMSIIRYTKPLLQTKLRLSKRKCIRETKHNSVCRGFNRSIRKTLTIGKLTI